MQINSSSESNILNIRTDNTNNKPSRKKIRKALHSLFDVHEGLSDKTKRKKKRLIRRILNVLVPKKEANQSTSEAPKNTDNTGTDAIAMTGTNCDCSTTEDQAAAETTTPTTNSNPETTSVNESVNTEEAECMESKQTEQAQIKKPGEKSYQEVIRDFVQPGDDGMLGEKEMQVGLIKHSLYQYDQNTLDAFSQEYEESRDLEQALNAIVSQGLIPQEDVDWVKSYTASAAETNRELDSNKQVDVELSNDTRYDYDAIINWSEANLAHIIHGNVVP